MGNVDAGKSTLLGVLTHGELDNGRGYARQKLFRHKHEAESGRTSSVGNDILGFDSEGQVSRLRMVPFYSKTWRIVVSKSSVHVLFILWYKMFHPEVLQRLAAYISRTGL